MAGLRRGPSHDRLCMKSTPKIKTVIFVLQLPDVPRQHDQWL